MTNLKKKLKDFYDDYIWNTLDDLKIFYRDYAPYIWVAIVCGFCIALVLSLTDWKQEDRKPIPIEEVKEEYTPKLYPKSDWKPKPPKIENNQTKWAGVGFNAVLKNECGDCKQACWHTEGDRGGTTCVGIASNRNPAFFSQVLNKAFENCKNKGVFMPSEGKPFGTKIDFCWHLRSYYWQHYVKPYSKCVFSAMVHLSDTAILQGPRATALILQRASDIMPDGKWGPQTQSQCSAKNWAKNKARFLTERKRYLLSLKDSKRFGQGWVKRVNDMAKEF